MKPTLKFLTRALTACLTFTFIFPAHAAPLALSQLPPTSVAPPAPNIIVTLDDSGSMATTVPFDVTQPYLVPPGPTGAPIAPQTTPPMAYVDGYATVLAPPVNVSTIAGYPASDADRQKFVNWQGFYRNRNMAMKAAVMSAFSPEVVPDDQFRIAWQGLRVTCYQGFPSPVVNCPTPNTMWTLSDGSVRNHRTNFFNWVRSVPASSVTPLRDAAERAGQYLLTTGVNSPWAHQPGVVAAPERSCRRSYHLLFTDGEYNNDSPHGNNDNVNVTLPDGVLYTQQRPYAGPATGGAFTLADIAFKYWATDLQTGAAFTNNLRPIIKKTGDELYGTASVPEYWNPKNNPATWQHMTTYAIGFGDAANITNPVWGGATTAGAGFARVVDGSAVWPSVGTGAGVRANLWQSAVNSRGDFFPATNQAALSLAFKTILSDIAKNNLTTGGSASSLGIPVAADFTLVKAGFVEEPTFRGEVKGYGISPGGIISGTASWDAQVVVGAQSPDSRVVLSAAAPLTGIPFRWANLSTYGKTSLNQTYTGFVDGLGADRVDFLRGSKDKEAIPDPATGVVAAGDVFRDRKGGLIGTVANSEPRIVQAPRSGYISPGYRAFRSANRTRTPIAYIGANDGMLHGIKTATGEAVLSYVPRAAYTKLPFYTDPAYTHNMYVDGPIISSDYQDASGWKTVLVSGLGAGGKGVFALDVTNPSTFSESNAGALVKFDYTAPAGALPTDFVSEAGTSPMLAELQTDMGHVYGDPSRDSFIGRNLQIAKMQNGKWAVITGNGVNSVNELAVLYVIYLDGSGFVKIPATLTADAAKPGNGLSIPFPADINGDGLTDTVYAGDLLGRMWKFNLKSINPTDWVLPENTNLVIATGRPISSAPTLLTHPQGGVLVSFGTGRQLTDADYSSAATESIYGIWDKPAGPTTVVAADLALRSLQAADEGTNVDADGTASAKARVFTGGVVPAVNYSTQRGWKIDLLKSKEKVIYNPIGDGTRVFYSTTLPVDSAAACTAADSGSFLAFDGITGTEPASPILDINGNGKFSGGGDKVDGRSVAGRSSGVGRLVGVVSPPPPPPCAGPGPCTPPPPPCVDPANLAVGAQGQMCVAKYGGPGRRLWRDLRP